jgi:GH35 family endo-1,4-beta-xylanase
MKTYLFIGMNWLMSAWCFAEEPAAWRVEADKRIEANRKGDVRLSVVDQKGNPVKTGKIEVHQTRHAFKFGTCVNQYWLRNQSELGEKYRAFIADHFSAMVAESAMKWPQTEPVRGTHDFSKSDLMVAFAKEHNLALRGHTLFWTKIKFKADWMREMEGEPLREAMKNHVDAIVSRYKHDVIAWDVNNEMLNAAFFEERVGKGIRPEIFKWAHAQAPEVPLFVNEYSILCEPDRVEAYLDLIKGLQNDGAKIGGIGIQEHAAERILEGIVSEKNTMERQSELSLSPEGIWESLDRLADETGLPIHITEISFRTMDPQQRADALDAFFRVMFAHEDVDVIMLWGFWVRSHWLGEQAALLDRDFNLLPAGEKLIELLEKEWKTRTDGDLEAGTFAFRGFYGSYAGEITLENGRTLPLQFELKKGQPEVSVQVQL